MKLALKTFYDHPRMFIDFLSRCFQWNESFIAQNNTWCAAIGNKSSNSICELQKISLPLLSFIRSREKPREKRCFRIFFKRRWYASFTKHFSKSSVHIEATNYSYTVHDEISRGKSQFELCCAIQETILTHVRNRQNTEQCWRFKSIIQIY